MMEQFWRLSPTAARHNTCCIGTSLKIEDDRHDAVVVRQVI